ncbi:MAG: hypothetical protein R3192_00600 [Woeseiaceae bacterium]|nr:hypothetical protein [Woeseiaceae bacterium]
MKTEQLGDWLQIIGLFGVIGSLIFVGLQLRQTQAIALSETYQGRTANTIEANNAGLSSPELLSGMSKIYTDKADELTMPEAIALEFHIGTILTMYENNELQRQAGFLSQEHWQRNLDELECMLTVPIFREIAYEWSFRESFQSLVSEALDRVPENAENCWTMGWEYPLQ